MAFRLTNELRRAGISTEMDYSDKSLKSQMKRADKLNTSFTLIIGDKEIDEKRVELRNMNTKNQQVLPMNNLRETIIKIIKER
jgi:Histidyl-tRNA synthetase